MAMEMSGTLPVLYVSGEESERQIKMRAVRLRENDNGDPVDLSGNLMLVTETNLNTILDHVQDVHPPC